MDFREFDVDPELEKAGVWIDEGDGCELLIAATGNPEYQRLVRKHLEPLWRKEQRGVRVPEEQMRAAFAKVFAGSILNGWKGVTDGGEPVPYSRAEAESRLKNQRFRAYIQGHAERLENFRASEIEEDAEHLGNESAGKPSGGDESPEPSGKSTKRPVAPE